MTSLQEVRDRAVVKLWSADEPCVAALLGLSKSAVYEAAARGDFPFVLQVGRRKLASVPGLLLWLGVNENNTGAGNGDGRALRSAAVEVTTTAGPPGGGRGG